jgi:hypothetical protein
MIVKNVSNAVSSHIVSIENVAFTRRRLSVEVLVNGRPDTVFYLGFGNEGKSVRRTMGLLLADDVRDFAVCAPLPYWNVPSSRESLDELALAGDVAVARYVTSVGNASCLHTIAES